jgi:hypothetical protein
MNIDTMPAGQELDALVAEKVMGWDIHFKDPELRGGKEHWRDHERSTNWLPEQWCPSSDISAAWEVLEKVQDVGSLERFGGFGWRCEVHSVSPNFVDCAAEGDTAPLAICRAALKAVSLTQQPSKR